MLSEACVSSVRVVQAAFQVVALLQLTAYLWPQNAVVENGATYDYIVVGAGTAGCVLANRLTENKNINVLLVDAGGDPPFESTLPGVPLYLMNSIYDWNYDSINDNYCDQCHQNSFFDIILGKMIGGTSSLNYMIYARGDDDDFNSWSTQYSANSWSWENVLPYYKKVEKVLVPEILNSDHKNIYGLDGMVPITQPRENDDDEINDILNAWTELGQKIVPDINHLTPVGQTKLKVNVHEGKRQGSALAYLSKVKKRPNLHVLKNTLVTKVIFDENKNAIGITAIKDKIHSITIKARNEVILSAGTFNSAKILMLSGIGPKEHLDSLHIPVLSDLPVGKNLQDHIAVILTHYLDDLTPLRVPLNPYEYPAIASMGHISLTNSNDKADYEALSFVVDPELINYYNAFTFKFKYNICDNLYRGGLNKAILFTQVLNLYPKSRGEVTLRSSNPLHKPIIKTKTFSEHSDLQNIAKYVRDFTRIEETSYFKRVNAVFADPTFGRCDMYNKNSDEYWECYSLCMSTNLSGFVGTCAMGTVVDETLKVKGVGRLRVADASIMPNITSARPSATIMMIGEKAADYIKKDLNIV